MAKESTSFVSLLAAAVVAVTGLVPVLWLLTSPAEESVVEEVVVSDATTTSSEFTTVVVEPVPELEVDELDPSIVRILQANGYAELTGQPTLDEQLPDAVTRVLIEQGAVLTVVEQDPAGEEG
ncbi:MAG: hypothetical protein GY926_09330 [bacterium]|nr:hypothetical protein [bacterium]MCP4965424.1 hypothetical protein [bacterium]